MNKKAIVVGVVSFIAGATAGFFGGKYLYEKRANARADYEIDLAREKFFIEKQRLRKQINKLDEDLSKAILHDEEEPEAEPEEELTPKEKHRRELEEKYKNISLDNYPTLEEYTGMVTDLGYLKVDEDDDFVTYISKGSPTPPEGVDPADIEEVDVEEEVKHYNVFSDEYQQRVKDLVGDEEEIPHYYQSDPRYRGHFEDIYPIQADMFGEGEYDRHYVTLFADGTLEDDYDGVIKDVRGTLGDDWEDHIGDEEPDTVVVRNEYTLIDYEVCRDLRTYEEFHRDE